MIENIQYTLWIFLIPWTASTYFLIEYEKHKGKVSGWVVISWAISGVILIVSLVVVTLWRIWA